MEGLPHKEGTTLYCNVMDQGIFLITHGRYRQRSYLQEDLHRNNVFCQIVRHGWYGTLEPRQSKHLLLHNVYSTPVEHEWNPVSWKTHLSLMTQIHTPLIWSIQLTGRVPGKAASKKATWEFVRPPKRVEAPLNNLDFDKICACTSSPITGSHLQMQWKLMH